MAYVYDDYGRMLAYTADDEGNKILVKSIQVLKDENGQTIYDLSLIHIWLTVIPLSGWILLQTVTRGSGLPMGRLCPTASGQPHIPAVRLYRLI